MIIATSKTNLDLGEFSRAQVEIIYLESVPEAWTDFISVFQIFLSSTEDALLLDFSLNNSLEDSVTRFKTVEYFDCFDISPPPFNLRRGYIKLVHVIKLMIFNLLFRLRFLAIDSVFYTRMAKSVIRARAIQEISNLVGAPKGVRVNFISKNLTTVIFSRRAASYFVAFNTDNTIDAASVFRSTLRSSNLSFGALQ